MFLVGRDSYNMKAQESIVFICKKGNKDLERSEKGQTKSWWDSLYVWMLSLLPRNDVLLSMWEVGWIPRNCRRCILIILFRCADLSFGWKEIIGAYLGWSSFKQREDDKSRDYLWIAICMWFDALLIPSWWVNHNRKAEKWIERKQWRRYVVIQYLRSWTIGIGS